MPSVHITIIGAGIIGLACAARLAKAGFSVLILEQASRSGESTSSRNSGVIHSGIYYPHASKKTTLCVRGRHLLYERCQRLGIPHRKLGKLIVATDDKETARLQALHKQGLNNDAGELRWLNAREAATYEPDVQCTSGLFSPETGIVDVHAYLQSFRHEALSHGAELVCHTRVVGLDTTPSYWKISTVDANGDPYRIRSTWVINAAGLHADQIAKMAGIDIDARGYRLHWCKGDYFSLNPSLGPRIRHLVYPIPVRAGLGIHLTIDTGGNIMAGPDTEYVDRIDYRVDATKRKHFAQALRRYLPNLPEEALHPNYAGIRPKLQGPQDDFRDFVIEESSPHGAPQMIQLIGIESPGLTASAAIAEKVHQLLSSAEV